LKERAEINRWVASVDEVANLVGKGFEDRIKIDGGLLDCGFYFTKKAQKELIVVFANLTVDSGLDFMKREKTPGVWSD
jgi:hypothetical protein